MKKKQRIAVIFGGQSSEHTVSLVSAAAVLEAIDTKQYEVIPVGISEEGTWFHYRGSYEKLTDQTWLSDPENLNRVTVYYDAKVKGLLELDETKNTFFITEIDLAFPVLHGKNGEDGTVQGAFELAGIPVIGCGTASSALCMDKDRAHKLVLQEGIRAPKSVSFRKEETKEALQQIKAQLSFPLFVKPVRAGSSIGISRVTDSSDLEAAIQDAFQYDEDVIVEEEIPGFEVGCAVMGCETLRTGRVDEIEIASGFFDFHEKYSLETSKIHMPARIDGRMEKKIQLTAKKIYRALGCSGFARVDMFLTPDGEIVFNEVNTIPGMTSHSRFPNMMKGVGMSFADVISEMIHSCVTA